MQCGIYISMSICKTQAEPNHFLVASGSPYSTTLSYNNVISSVSPIFFPNRPTLLHSFQAPLPLLHCLQSMNSHSIIYQTLSVGPLLILGLDSRKGPFFTLWTSNQKMLVQPSEIFMHSDIYKDDAFQLFVAKLNPNHPPVSYILYEYFSAAYIAPCSSEFFEIS